MNRLLLLSLLLGFIPSVLEMVLRIWADLTIIAGFIIAATVKFESEK